MTRRPAVVLAAIALVVGSCGGEAEPGPSTSTSITGAEPVTTTAAAAEASVPDRVVDGVIALLAGTPLGAVEPDDVAADVAVGCAAAADAGGTGGFLEAIRAVVAARAERVGEPSGGAAAARYRQALEAAFLEVCPDDYAAALDGGEPARPVEAAPGAPLDEALEALVIGLEGTAFEGIVGGSWPADELSETLDDVCRVADEGGSNIEVFESVAGEIRRRYEAAGGELDLLAVTVITVAVVFRCPEHNDTVLGP